MPLRHGKDYHVGCPFKSKAACERARQEQLGHCTMLTQEGNECSHWATDRDNYGKSYCTQHLAAITLADFKAKRQAARKAAMDANADAFIAHVRQFPSVWSQR